MATRKKTTTRNRAAARKTAARKPPARKSGALSITGIAPSFTADDVEQSLAFYRDVLGFVVKDRWEEGGRLLGVELLAGSVVFMLSQDDWKKGRERVKGEGFRLYCQTTQDVDALAAGIKARGGTLLQEPRDEPWGARTFAVEDPDGFKITFSTPLR